MVIKVKRGLLSGLDNSGAIDGEIKFIKDTNDLYVYNDTAPAGNRNVTSPLVVSQSTGGLATDTDYIITNTNLFRFYSIYCTINGNNTSPIRIPREMLPQSGTTVYPVWYYSGTILTFDLTFTYVNSTSVKVRHSLSSSTINIYIYKEK